MACIVCYGSGKLLDSVCPLCDGLNLSLVEGRVDELSDVMGAWKIDDKYNFRLVTADVSKEAAPGDDGPGSTNERYKELMNEIEKTLKSRPDYTQLNWESNATRIASDEELLLDGVHTEAFIHAMGRRTEEAQIRERAIVRYEVSAGWSKDTEVAARTSMAALIDCAKDVFSGKYKHGFVLARPPSHHAVGNEQLARNGSPANLPFGFCHVNSIASAVVNLRKDHPGLRTCIFDFDVHPGNGNEDTFYNDPSVLTISIHQCGIWPGRDVCREDYVGGSRALGSVFNLPVLSGAGDTDYYYAMNRYIFPEIEAFKPDIIFLAAGYDALNGDPYADQQLTVNWYGWCIAELMRMDIPLVLNLEGGYSPKHVAEAVDKSINALAGTPAEAFLNHMTIMAERERYTAHCREMYETRARALNRLKPEPPESEIG